MTPEKISNAINQLDATYVTEALSYPSAFAKRIRTKRLLLRVGSLAACFCLIFSGVLISCSKATRLLLTGEPERAVAFMSIVNQTKNKANSYSSSTQLSMSASYEGCDYTATVTESTQTVNQTKKTQFASFSEVEIDTCLGSGASKQTVTYGYQDGKMFQSTYKKANSPSSSAPLGEESKMWAAMSYKDYQAFVREYRDLFGLNFDPKSSMSKSCVQEKDKSWTAIFSGFSDEEINKYARIVVGMEEMLVGSYLLSDFAVRVRADESFYPLSVEFVFAFEKNLNNKDASVESPRLTVTTTYQDFNAIGAVSVVDLSDYREVDDLRIGDVLAQAVAERRGADQGVFRFTEEELHHRNIGKENENIAHVKSESTYSYTYQNHSCCYRAITTYLQYPGIYHTHMVYDAIGLTVEFDKNTGEWINEWPSSYNSPEEDWLEHRQSIINVGTFDQFNVADIQLIDADNGTYKITITNPGYGAYEEKIYRGWSVTQVEATVLVVIRNGRVSEWVYEHDITTDHTERGGEHRIYRVSCVFKDDVSEFDFDIVFPDDWKWN